MEPVIAFLILSGVYDTGDFAVVRVIIQIVNILGRQQVFTDSNNLILHVVIFCHTNIKTL